ncbi:MAG: type II toxin-antitoxin system VapC family toxin [Chitinophagales bacterium]
MKQALLDTDTVSYFLKGNKNVITTLKKYLLEFGTINISIITYYEILNGLYYKNAQRQLEKFMAFIDFSNVIPLTKNSATIAANITAELKKNGNFIGHNDVLIAGIAIENNYTLITNNTNHFSRIENLEIDNWKLS